jgi:hypothetical protein
VRNDRNSSRLYDTAAVRLQPVPVTHADLEKRVETLVGELEEALEQQRATSEVLRVISSSPGELELVFQTMLAHAIRICEANFGALFRFKDGAASAAAMLGVPPAFAEFWQRGPYRPGSGTALGRVIGRSDERSGLDRQRAGISGANFSLNRERSPQQIS